MEELRNLETLHRLLSFMESRDLINSSNNDSNRFLADLIMLLAKPYGDIDINDKLNLITQVMPKFSPSIVAEVSSVMGGEDKDTVLVDHDRNAGDNFVQGGDSEGGGGGCCMDMNLEDVPVIGLDAMHRANSTLEDFVRNHFITGDQCRSYFMFHGLDANRPQQIFRYLPMLSFTESYIYQLDTLNERISNESSVERRYKEVSDAFKRVGVKPFQLILEHHKLLTERIRKELACGEEYWMLERKLCSSFINKTEISTEDAMRAIHLKSFDYRVLNLLLYQLRGEKVNDLHMEFLSISEFLVEISDDLFDYEDDVLANHFNILRMFVRIYGSSAAPAMLAKYIAEAEEKYDLLLNRLDPQLSLNYRRRCEEATKEGGKTSGHSFGTWNIPAVIVDEYSYRSNFST